MAEDIPRCRRILLIGFLSFAETILNILYWLAYIYPNFKIFKTNLQTICAIYEAIVIIFGFHMYKLLGIWILDRVHTGLGLPTPKWIHRYYIIRTIFVIISTICGYSLALFARAYGGYFSFIQWKLLFYIVFGYIVVIESSIVLWSLFKALNAIRQYRDVGPNAEIKSAELLVKFVMSIVFIFFLSGNGMVVLCFEGIWNVVHVEYNLYLVDAIFHSGMVIIVISTFIIWIYLPKTCCTIPDDSICVVYCCGECFAYYCLCCFDTDIEFSRSKSWSRILIAGNGSDLAVINKKKWKKKNGSMRTDVGSINNTNNASKITSLDSKDIPPQISIIAAFNAR
eukprot:9367_1